MESRKRKNYNFESLKEAFNKVKTGLLSVRQAAAQYNVPKSTLYDKVAGKKKMDAIDGKPSKLSTEDERKLIDFAAKRARLGIGFSTKSFKEYAGSIAQQRGVPFKNGVPSEKWWTLLKRRHQDFSLRTPESTSVVRHMAMREGRIKSFFSVLENQLVQDGLMSTPTRCWNMDETYLSLSVNSSKIIARRGEKSLHSKTGSRENVTLLACGNAAGTYLPPPHIIVKGKTRTALRSWDTEQAPPNTFISVSESGWTKKGLTQLWFEEIFLKNIGPERPQVLIFDGHESHHHVELVHAAVQNNITLIEIPSHCSHWLQPLDRTVFGSLKASWRQAVTDFTTETACPVKHGNFFRLFNQVWTNLVSDGSLLVSGFRATGIHPVNFNAIPQEAYVPAITYKRQDSTEPIHDHDIDTSNDNVTSTNTTDINDIADIAVLSDDVQVLDLGIVLSDDGVVTQMQQVPSDTSSVCPPELALAAIECSLSLAEKAQFETALVTGNSIPDPRFHSWLKYKEMTNKEETMTSGVIESSQLSPPDLFQLPEVLLPASKKTDGFFVITCEDAYKNKLQKSIEKEVKEKQKQERKKKAAERKKKLSQ